MDACHSKPDAIDLSHHLSSQSRARLASPLKGMYKYFGKPGMLMFAGGLPSTDYFPYESISAQVLAPNTFRTTQSSFAWLWSLLSNRPASRTITIPKFEQEPTPESIQLSTALQYGTAAGLPALAKFINEFVDKVFDPGYGNWEIVINAGSTDAWGKICSLILEPGDGILCEEWTYPSALATAWPNGFRPVALPMDGAGMTPEGLEHLLANWDKSAHDGMRRPRLLYTIPVCQNPTGATMTAERKRKIYEICVKYDVIIAEDDPYYFLQAGEYERNHIKPTKTETDEEFLASLTPSYLKFDYQGRVIRIDTFSKTICPGSRLGWTTANPVFIERLQRANESSTQSASGFAQAMVAKLLVDGYGMQGWFRWLKGLKAQYRDRRDLLVDCLLEQAHAGLDARTSSDQSGAITFALHKKDTRSRDEKGFLEANNEKRISLSKDEPLLSFVAPQGGMFVWLRVHFSNHPSYPRISTSKLVYRLWEQIAESNVLVAPGTMFSGRTFGQPLALLDSTVPSTSDEVLEHAMCGSGERLIMTPEGDGFFRISFSTASEKDMRSAMKTIGKCVADFWRDLPDEDEF
ncbi:hypothetical protein OIO90_004586 [Microbotryomycetes sp. JL221]|nr:hypothetical protein OIO90_004586 [Microbotryomycetes sp. JL221]